MADINLQHIIQVLTDHADHTIFNEIGCSHFQSLTKTATTPSFSNICLLHIKMWFLYVKYMTFVFTVNDWDNILEIRWFGVDLATFFFLMFVFSWKFVLFLLYKIKHVIIIWAKQPRCSVNMPISCCINWRLRCLGSEMTTSCWRETTFWFQTFEGSFHSAT